ncbi:MAG: DUF3393 domain-containing protein [Sulfurimonas sp.]|nr:DUF3393 domain-containing protein [Sulfurimonas sp.]
MLRNLLILASLSCVILAQSWDEYNKEQTQVFEQHKKEFGIYQKSQDKEFESYKQAQDNVFLNYKKEVGAIWEKPKMSTKTTWVAYTPDKKTRTDVDFSKETILVETIASSPIEAKLKLEVALGKVVTIDNGTLQRTDPLQNALSKVKKPFGLVDAQVKNEPILSTVIFDESPTKKAVDNYVKNHITDSKIEVIKSNKKQHFKVYSVKIQMPKDAMIKRSKLYYDEVKKQASKRKLPISLVFAIMHSESSFNPRARSHVPAYGLMQIVPRTAGIDTYRFLYKKKKLVSSSYLYNSTNNITMGTAYLHILYYRYLRDIKDPTSRLYCTIAAYNTGAGNIAWAFVGKHNMSEAAPLINALTSKEVYNKLLKDLRYEEPKHYLKKVSRRMNAYHRVYGS